MSLRARSEVLADHRLPDFFIVGQSKSGTTAVYEMLRQHPGIYMPSEKEPSFFCSDLCSSNHGGPSRSLADYLELFRDATPRQCAGEASPTYIWSQVAAQRIAELQPRAKIIVILRDPATFIASLHLELLQHGLELETDLEHALALEDLRRRGERLPPATVRPKALLYSDRVRYVEQLMRYHVAFPRDQVLVLIYDDLRADNNKILRTILAFLGVDDGIALQPVEANPSVRVRSSKAQAVFRSLYLGEGPVLGLLKGLIKTAVPTSLRRSALATTQQRLVFGKPRPPDEELMQELRRRFKPEVVALSEYLGRDLVARWGYDHVQ